MQDGPAGPPPTPSRRRRKTLDAAIFSADRAPALPLSFTGYTLHRAANPLEVLEAQRLRYQIFALEKGANIDGGGEDLDVDFFDDYCEHLLVRDRWGSA